MKSIVVALGILAVLLFCYALGCFGYQESPAVSSGGDFSAVSTWGTTSTTTTSSGFGGIHGSNDTYTTTQ